MVLFMIISKTKQNKKVLTPSSFTQAQGKPRVTPEWLRVSPGDPDFPLSLLNECRLQTEIKPTWEWREGRVEVEEEVVLVRIFPFAN